MKRFVLILIAFVAVLTGTFISQQALAQTVLSDEQTERIRQNCVAAQTTLNQLRSSDALLRVNRGRLYENISTKLMAPLNSRITLKGLGGLRLTATTVEYDRQLDVFRTSYIEYVESMSDTIRIDCVEQPAGFYDNVRITREARQKLYEDTRTLTMLLEAYKTEFEIFADEFEGDAQ